MLSAVRPEHPEYNKDVAVIELCKPLLFSEGELSQVFLTVL